MSALPLLPLLQSSPFHSAVFDSFAALGALFAIFVLVGLSAMFVARYKRCPANRVLVISGKVGGGNAARCISGGGAFVWPVIQEYAYLSLEPIQIDLPLKDALSFENIRVAVPSVCTVAIGTEAEIGRASCRDRG